jgi:hypothetical protein
MIKVSGEYRGYTIKWVDYERAFIILLDTTPLTRKTNIEDCEKYIDSQLKTKYKKIPVLYRDWQSWKMGEATSIQDNDSAWVVSDGKRGKYRLSEVYIDNESNRKQFEAYKANREKITEIVKENQAILNVMETLKPEMMVINAGDNNG